MTEQEEEEPKFVVRKCRICGKEFAAKTEKPYCGLCVLNYARLKKT